MQVPYGVDFGNRYPRLPRFFFSRTGCGVIKPHISHFYSLAAYLTPVKSLQAGMQLSGNIPVIQIFTYARIGLIFFTSQEWLKAYLPSSHQWAEIMATFLDEEIIKLPKFGAWDATLEKAKIEGFKSQIERFEAILDDELGKLPVFVCEDELLGNLSVDKLLKGAHHGYSAVVKDVLRDQCKAEIDEAGRCLIYERSTASGFHILRAVELAIKQYLCLIPNFAMPPLNRQNWGEYIQLLKDNGASKEITDTLQSIKVNHRNPLMHPEDTLDLPEAVSLMAVCQSMCEVLISDMKKRGLA